MQGSRKRTTEKRSELHGLHCTYLNKTLAQNHRLSSTMCIARYLQQKNPHRIVVTHIRAYIRTYRIRMATKIIRLPRQ